MVKISTSAFVQSKLPDSHLNTQLQLEVSPNPFSKTPRFDNWIDKKICATVQWTWVILQHSNKPSARFQLSAKSQINNKEEIFDFYMWLGFMFHCWRNLPCYFPSFSLFPSSWCILSFHLNMSGNTTKGYQDSIKADFLQNWISLTSITRSFPSIDCFTLHFWPFTLSNPKKHPKRANYFGQSNQNQLIQTRTNEDYNNIHLIQFKGYTRYMIACSSHACQWLLTLVPTCLIEFFHCPNWLILWMWNILFIEGGEFYYARSCITFPAWL